MREDESKTLLEIEEVVVKTPEPSVPENTYANPFEPMLERKSSEY
jgi:hypothetical protein